MKDKPYEIRIKDSQLPRVIIQAPGIEAQPHAWRTRLQWAWRCLRGQSLDLNPAIILTDCFIESASMIGCQIETNAASVVSPMGGDAGEPLPR